MLTVTMLDEFRAHVSDKEEIREMDIGHNQVSFCYMISGQDTFSTPWHRECRGITFNKKGRVSSRPLHKFFNVNERESTRVENLDWTKVVRVMDKRDGSMIHSVWTDNGLKFKSKKSFESDVAKAAQKWINDQPDRNVERLSIFLAGCDSTAIFEWTAPDARIVLLYEQPELRLLHIRSNTYGTYWKSHELRRVAEEYGVKVVDEPIFDVPYEQLGTHLLKLAETIEGIEGWVIQFQDGEMVKLKTDWYQKRHRAMTFLRERDIAELVIAEGLDDLKSLLIGDGINIDEILKIEARIVANINEIGSYVDKIYLADKEMTRKDFAIKHNGDKYFGLLMSKFTGKEPDYKGFFERNILKQEYTLRQLVMIPTVAEVE